MGTLPHPGEAVELDTLGWTTRNWRIGITVSGCLSAVLVQDVGGRQLEQAEEQRDQLAFLASSTVMSKSLLYRCRKASPVSESSAEAIAGGLVRPHRHDLPRSALGGVSQLCSAQKAKAARRY